MLTYGLDKKNKIIIGLETSKSARAQLKEDYSL